MACTYKETDRTFLYVMVFITMMSSCSLDTDVVTNDVETLDAKITTIEAKLDKVLDLVE